MRNKNAYRLGVMMTYFVMMMLNVASAKAVYPTILPFRVPRIAQVASGGIGSDCYVCSIASINAYHLGTSQYSYTSTTNVSDTVAGTVYTRTYDGARDYDWKADPLWHFIVDKNYYYNKKYGTGAGYEHVYMQLDSYASQLPRPVVRESVGISDATTLAGLYRILSAGKPVVFHASANGYMHASVIIGYRGKDASALKLSDFTVMEIKKYNNTWLHNEANFSAYATNPCLTTNVNISHCYYSLDAWLQKTFKATNITGNICYYSGSVYPTEITPISSEKISFTVVANGSNRLSANISPYGASPASRMLSVGDTVKTVGAVKNSFGNTWYLLENGTYVWDGILSNPVDENSAAIHNLTPSGGTYFYGSVPSVKGTVVASSAINWITAELYTDDSSETGTGQSARHDFGNRNTLSVALENTTIGNLNTSALHPGIWNLTIGVNFGSTNPKTKYFEYEFEVIRRDIVAINAPSEVSIRSGDTARINLSVEPPQADASSLIWKIDNPSLMRLNADRSITALYTPEANQTTLRITAPNGVSKTITLKRETNIVSESFTLNGYHASGEPYVDVFSLGQSVPFSYTYTLANDYDPGYEVVISADSDIGLRVNNGRISFDKVGVSRLHLQTDVSDKDFGLMVVTSDEKHMHLPEQLTVLEDEAFVGSAADYFTIRKPEMLGKNVFSDDAIVFLDTSGLKDDAADAGARMYIECGAEYNAAFASVHADRYYIQRGVTIPTLWSDWSEWTETEISENEYTQVERKTQYRSAPITQTQVLGPWGEWSIWLTYAQTISDSNYMQEQTRITYPYYYFFCSNCGKHMPYYGYGCYRDLGGCGRADTVRQDSWTEGIWLPVNKSQCISYNNGAKYYTVGGDGHIYFYWSESPQASRTEYRYRYRSNVTVEQIGEYGEWMDDVIVPSDKLSVQTRVLYRFRTVVK